MQTLRRSHPMVDKDFQVEPPFLGIKIAPVLITRAAIQIMLNQR